ncbi:MAG: trypsin-like peptidase domain-containing protein [Clostridia bacterium]|nr:trypsin-like peptidase domain-containing protein [Clostridia bacterium]
MYNKDENLNNEVYDNLNGARQNQAAEAPVMPPQDRYTCYSDGSSKNAGAAGYPYYTPNGAPYGEIYRNSPPPPKRSKAGMITAVVVALLLVAGLGFAGYILWQGFVDELREEVSEGHESSVLVNNKGNSSTKKEPVEYESIPEVVTVNPVPDENYDSLVELYNKCAPSCVSIICTVEYNNGFYVQEGVSLGSGFVIEGTDPTTKEQAYYIITNHHVIDNAKSIEVKFYDDSTYTATLIGSDEMTDIAVLTIEKTDLIPLEIGDSDSLMVGQWVIAIGTPSDEEFAGTMSYGIISGVNRALEITNNYGTVVKTMTVIQTTATLNPGNSGGPLINMAGQVIGINAMKLSESYEGMGFALPSTSAMNIINSLIAYGEVVDRTDSFAVGSAKLGITGATVTDEIIAEYNLGEECPKGVLVTVVSRGTAVYEAGLSIYDIITEFDGEKIESIEQLQAAIKKAGAGTTVEMTFYRLGRLNEEGSYHTITFKLDYAS